MLFILSMIGAILLIGLCVMIVSIRNAPEGFEDRSGFHVITRDDAEDLHGARSSRGVEHTVQQPHLSS